MNNPMTACGCFECIAMVIPEANGVMVVSREDAGHDPGRDEVLHAGRHRGRRPPDARHDGHRQVLYASAPSSSRPMAGSSAWSGCPRTSRTAMADELQAVAEREGDPRPDRPHRRRRHCHRGGRTGQVARRKGSPGAQDAADGTGARARGGGCRRGQRPRQQPPPSRRRLRSRRACRPRRRPSRQQQHQSLRLQPEAASLRQLRHPTQSAVPVVPDMPVSMTVPDIQAIAQMSANMVIDQIRAALAAALGQLGGTVPAPAPAAPAPVAGPAARGRQQRLPRRVEAPPAAPSTRSVPSPSAPPGSRASAADVQLAHEKWTGQVLRSHAGRDLGTGRHAHEHADHRRRDDPALHVYRRRRCPTRRRWRSRSWTKSRPTGRRC